MDEQEHARTIIHIHTDCCSLQEINSNTIKPIAIQNNNIIFGCNQEAQSFGVQRNLTVTEARSLCPNLDLINNDLNALHEYRQLSYAVTTHLQRFSKCVERLGLDENYLDISDVVEQKFDDKCKIIGDVYGTSANRCLCGCYERLKFGTHIAEKIRKSLAEELGLQCIISVSHNKLYAKLISDLQQRSPSLTVLFPPNGLQLLMGKSIKDVPGFPKSVVTNLSELGACVVRDLKDLDYDQLDTRFGKETIKYLEELSRGIDSTPVRSRSVALEDVPRATATVETSIRDTLEGILKRLLALLAKDKRTPRRMELLVRKYDIGYGKMSRKESKYVNLLPKLFTATRGTQGHMTSDTTTRQLHSMTMKLFLKAVDITKPFHVTLLGLSFQRFIESPIVSANLLQRPSLEVQAVTNIQYKPDYSHLTGQMMDCCSSMYSNSDNTDGSESEMEPSPKKRKCKALPYRRCFEKQCPSPSKLKVAELRINSET